MPSANLVVLPSLFKEVWSSQLCKSSRGAYASLPRYRPCPRSRVPAAVPGPPAAPPYKRLFFSSLWSVTLYLSPSFGS